MNSEQRDMEFESLTTLAIARSRRPLYKVFCGWGIKHINKPDQLLAF